MIQKVKGHSLLWVGDEEEEAAANSIVEDCRDWEGEGEGSCSVDHCLSPVGDPDAEGTGVLHSDELSDAGWAFRLPGVKWLMVDCITRSASKVDEKGSPSASFIILVI